MQSIHDLEMDVKMWDNGEHTTVSENLQVLVKTGCWLVTAW